MLGAHFVFAPSCASGFRRRGVYRKRGTVFDTRWPPERSATLQYRVRSCFTASCGFSARANEEENWPRYRPYIAKILTDTANVVKTMAFYDHVFVCTKLQKCTVAN